MKKGGKVCEKRSYSRIDNLRRKASLWGKWHIRKEGIWGESSRNVDLTSGKLSQNSQVVSGDVENSSRQEMFDIGS